MAIQTFYKQAQSHDFARLFQFRVTQFPGTISLLNDKQLLYVETAALPGRTINNIQVPYMGLQFNVPGTASYPGSNAYNVTFRVDEDYDIRESLETATFGTFDDATSGGAYKTPDASSILQLELLSKAIDETTSEPKAVRTYKLFGAYVVAVADTAYDIKDTGTVSTCQATIAYQFWRVTSGSEIKQPENKTPVRRTTW
jgi:hypothetical protein